MNIEIFRKEFTSYYDYLTLELMFPTVFVGKINNSQYPKQALYLKFGNNLKLEKDTVSYHFRFRVFGFGFGVYRQWSY